eukprot:Pgem_evm1s1950
MFTYKALSAILLSSFYQTSNAYYHEKEVFVYHFTTGHGKYVQCVGSGFDHTLKATRKYSERCRFKVKGGKIRSMDYGLNLCLNVAGGEYHIPGKKVGLYDCDRTGDDYSVNEYNIPIVTSNRHKASWFWQRRPQKDYIFTFDDLDHGHEQLKRPQKDYIFTFDDLDHGHEQLVVQPEKQDFPYNLLRAVK